MYAKSVPTIPYHFSVAPVKCWWCIRNNRHEEANWTFDVQLDDRTFYRYNCTPNQNHWLHHPGTGSIEWKYRKSYRNMPKTHQPVQSISVDSMIGQVILDDRGCLLGTWSVISHLFKEADLFPTAVWTRKLFSENWRFPNHVNDQVRFRACSVLCI